MIAEDYVSFEIAKLLKEKGFDIPLNYYYNSDGRRGYATSYNWNQTTGDFPDYSCPTLQTAMKFLRQVHNLVIEPYRTACGYLYTISSIPYGSTKYDNSEAYNGDDEASGQWTTWEKACEDGIKYCLENLI